MIEFILKKLGVIGRLQKKPLLADEEKLTNGATIYSFYNALVQKKLDENADLTQINALYSTRIDELAPEVDDSSYWNDFY